MAVDGLTLLCVVNELKVLIGGKIDKVNQPEKDEIILSIRNGGLTYSLLISASPNNCRVQLTAIKKANPMEAFLFCMLLRKRILGGKIIGIEQKNSDRVVLISIEALNDMYEKATYVLVAEIMGKHSNIILLDDEKIIDSIKRVTPAMSSVRVVLPGASYETLKTDKIDPIKVTPDDFLTALNTNKRPDKALSDAFYGLSPVVARELIATFVSNIDHANKLIDIECKIIALGLSAFYSKAAKGEFEPVTVYDEFKIPRSVLPFKPNMSEKFYEREQSVSQALDKLYKERAVIEHFSRRASSLKRIVDNNIERCEKKLTLYSDAINGEAEAENFKLYGELIIANLYKLKQGDKLLIADNYYNFPVNTEEIHLDPLKTPVNNAQSYYKKYQKAKASRDMARKMYGTVESELMYLRIQADNLEKCTLDSELSEIREELIDVGFIKREKGKKQQKFQPSHPLRFVLEDGTEIYIGKNNVQNDFVTFKIAISNDTWLHVKDVPGSHCIIKTLEPSNEALYSAAMLAAFYSSAKNGINVAVDYTLRKYVKKISGAKLGMVTYSNNHTIFVTPSEEFVKSIQK
ncbi:MAG: NFACT RNA binding domain-containing protein [Clostridia bacterium]